MLERFDGARDACGGVVGAWEPLRRVWAELAPESLGAPSRFQAILRWLPDTDPARPRAGMRLRDADRIFAIRAVVERDSRRRHLICRIEEEAPR